MAQKTFKRNAHINYFARCLHGLPAAAEGHDGNRITVAYFCLSGLDLLGALEEKTSQSQREEWIEWIWSLQARTGGFRGSTYATTPNEATSPAHLPSTYTALLCLATLRAPLDRLDLPGLRSFLASCQCEDGSFSPLPRSDEYASAGFQNDMRMSYCATIISDVAKGGVDRASSVRYIKRCRTWEGGYGARPGLEAQGGTTYCAVTSLGPEAEDRSGTLRWLLQRQIGGFQGRPGKLEDACYSFWCGGAIALLQEGDIINNQANSSFLLSAQSPLGGFGKEPDDYPDPFHSYLALAAMALTESHGLRRLDPRWNLSRTSTLWLEDEINRIHLQSV